MDILINKMARVGCEEMLISSNGRILQCQQKIADKYVMVDTYMRIELGGERKT